MRAKGPFENHTGKISIYLFRHLCDNGANVNQQTEDGWTPLIYATVYGHTGIAKILIAKNASVDPVDKDGRNALWYAESYGRHEIVWLLRENGAE